MEQNENLSDQDRQLASVQNKRLAFIEELGKQTAVMLSDPTSARVYLAALKDADAQALGIKRIKSDEDVAMEDARVAREMNVVLLSLERTTGNPFRRASENDRIAAGHKSNDSALLPEITVIEGQTSIGIESSTYAEFTERVQPQLDAKNKAEA